MEYVDGYSKRVRNLCLIETDKKKEIKEKRQRKNEEKQKAEKLKIFQIQSNRQSSGLCIMCSKPLGIFRKLIIGSKKHKRCTSFKEI